MFKAKETKVENTMKDGDNLRNRTVPSAPSILGEGITVIGSINATGDVQIEGNLEGDVTASSLTIGEKAEVKGEIRAESVLIHGNVKGSIRGRNVHLASTARVEGDIIHALLAVENSALLEGRCRRMNDPLKDSEKSSGFSPKAADAPKNRPQPISVKGFGTDIVGKTQEKAS